MSRTFHWAGRIFGAWGFLALLAAWAAGGGGTTLGFSQQHLYNDAIVLMLTSISALICAQVYLQQGK